MSVNSQLKNVFSNTFQIITTTIASGQTSSPAISCLSLNGSGPGVLRVIDFPSNWTPGDVTFQKANTVSGTYLDLGLSDGATSTGLLTFPAVPVSFALGLPNPAWFDFVQFFKIVCSVAQVETVTLTLGFQPIYQGQA